MPRYAVIATLSGGRHEHELSRDAAGSEHLRGLGGLCERHSLGDEWADLLIRQKSEEMLEVLAEPTEVAAHLLRDLVGQDTTTGGQRSQRKRGCSSGIEADEGAGRPPSAVRRPPRSVA